MKRIKYLTRNLEMFLHYGVIILAIIIALFPIYWIFQSSIKPAQEQLTIPPLWFPTSPTFHNYLRLFKETPIGRTVFNSILVTFLSVTMAMLLGTPAAYSLARFKVGKPHLPFLILMVRMTPPIVFILPLFLLARKLGLHGTYLSLLITYTFFNIPMVIWMMMGFFSELPFELEEAALVDGCSRLEAMGKIVLPLTAPGLAATAVFCSILSWNEFLFALVLTNPRTRTLPVLVNSFVTQKSVDYGLMCATGVIMVMPMILFGLLVQRHLVRGLTAGAIKG